jgi:hypothetical protein
MGPQAMERADLLHIMRPVSLAELIMDYALPDDLETTDHCSTFIRAEKSEH